jgi:two-component system sensor histidine kinase KdpD
MRTRTLRKSVQHLLTGGVAVAILTAFCYQAHFDFAAAIPLYLLLVVLQSLTGDFPSSAMISTLAAGCLDFFFTEPLFSVRVTNPLNVLALLAFIFTALVITNLVSRARTEALSARLQKERLDRLYQLSRRLLALDPEAAMTETFLLPFRQLFGITAVCVFDAERGETRIVGDSAAALAAKTRGAYISGRDLDEPDSRIAVCCLQFGEKLKGAVGFEGLQEPKETAGSLAALTTALIERTDAFHKASAASAEAQTEIYRSTVLDALAHEFQTPLATILAAAGGLREAGPLAPIQREMADTVESETARLGRLTTRLLRTARLDAAEIKPRMELLELTSLVRHVADQYAARSSDRRILVANPHTEVLVLADPELLRLTANQLIENACKYSQPGSTVTIEIDRQGDFVALRVSNSGSSIPPHERGHIFERFYRGADAKRSTSGSGLGLYVARKIARAHGGALDLEMEERAEDSVTFCLKIPSAKDESNHAAVAK